MKFKLAILGLFTILLSSNGSFAASVPLNEFNWDSPSSKSSNSNINGHQGASSNGKSDNCNSKCTGYSIETTNCGDGESLEACDEVGCGNMFKCVATPCAQGFSTAVKDCDIEIQEDNFLCTKCMAE